MKRTYQHIVEKKWGKEEWIVNTPEYCAKKLIFTEKLNKFSLHYHMMKNETWYVMKGAFKLIYVDTEKGIEKEMTLQTDDIIDIKKGFPHQLIALEDNSIIFEVSTQHFDSDSYRIRKDSQL